VNGSGAGARALPLLFVIGDSISMHYGPPLAAALAARGEVLEDHVHFTVETRGLQTAYIAGALAALFPRPG
jgi:hypothetical protein